MTVYIGRFSSTFLNEANAVRSGLITLEDAEEDTNLLEDFDLNLPTNVQKSDPQAFTSSSSGSKRNLFSFLKGSDEAKSTSTISSSSTFSQPQVSTIKEQLQQQITIGKRVKVPSSYSKVLDDSNAVKSGLIALEDDPDLLDFDSGLSTKSQPAEAVTTGIPLGSLSNSLMGAMLYGAIDYLYNLNSKNTKKRKGESSVGN